MPYVYASIPVGGILIIFYSLIFIMEDIKEMNGKPAEPAAAEQK